MYSVALRVRRLAAILAYVDSDNEGHVALNAFGWHVTKIREEFGCLRALSPKGAGTITSRKGFNRRLASAMSQEP